MITNRLLYYVKRLEKERKPIKFIIATFLWLTHLCRFLTIERKNIYTVRFYPTSLSAKLWTYPDILRFEEVFVLQYLRSEDIFIDVGANIGTVTLCGAVTIGEKGKVIAIEAHPRIFNFLSENLRRNCVNNVDVYNLAVGSTTGTIHFSNMMSDLRNHVVNGSQGISVTLDTLDNVMNIYGYERIQLMKIDVEGYEAFVLQGATETLKRVDTLFIESTGHAEHYGYHNKDLFEILLSHGFRIFSIDSHRNDVIATNSFDQLIKRLPNHNFSEIQRNW